MSPIGPQPVHPEIPVEPSADAEVSVPDFDSLTRGEAVAMLVEDIPDAVQVVQERLDSLPQGVETDWRVLKKKKGRSGVGW